MNGEADEIWRIQEAYRRRDEGRASQEYTWSNRAYAFYMQDLEWELLRALEASGVDLSAARVLDVGCGSGYFLHRLVEFGARDAVGVDLMPHRVEQARRRYPSLEFRQANATELRFEDGSFDLVTQFTCLSSVLDPDVRAAIGAELMRVLAPGGVALSFDMRPPTAPVRVLGAAARGLARLRRSGAAASASTPVQPLDVDELCRVFGGEPIVSRPVVLHPEIAAVAIRSRLLAQLIARVAPLRSHLLVAFRKR